MVTTFKKTINNWKYGYSVWRRQCVLPIHVAAARIVPRALCTAYRCPVPVAPQRASHRGTGNSLPTRSTALRLSTITAQEAWRQASSLTGGLYWRVQVVSDQHEGRFPHQLRQRFVLRSHDDRASGSSTSSSRHSIWATKKLDRQRPWTLGAEGGEVVVCIRWYEPAWATPRDRSDAKLGFTWTAMTAGWPRQWRSAGEHGKGAMVLQPSPSQQRGERRSTPQPWHRAWLCMLSSAIKRCGTGIKRAVLCISFGKRIYLICADDANSTSSTSSASTTSVAEVEGGRYDAEVKATRIVVCAKSRSTTWANAPETNQGGELIPVKRQRPALASGERHTRQTWKADPRRRRGGNRREWRLARELDWRASQPNWNTNLLRRTSSPHLASCEDAHSGKYSVAVRDQ